MSLFKTKGEQKPRPPKAARWVLRRWGPLHRNAEMTDDLEELFALRTERYGPAKAQRLYWQDVLSICLRRSLHTQQAPHVLPYETARGPIMLTNYLKIAFRHLQRQKGYTFINVAGLAVGLACCLLIVLYVQDERSYDRHHHHADRIFRLTINYHEGSHWAPIGPPVGPALMAQMPEIEQIARIFPFGNRAVLRYEDLQFEESGGVYADSTVFEVFTLPLLRGNPATALTAPGSLVLSQRMARKYFGEADPMGRTLTVPGWRDFTVTAIMKDVPTTTHLPFDFMASMQTYYDARGDGINQARTWAGFYTYVLLREAHQAEAVVQKAPAFATGFFEGRFETPADEVMQFVLQPLPEIHLHSKLEKEYRANSDVLYVYVFSAIALFVLLIACINFINLATALAAMRMREVGVRKTLGAGRLQLARQFLGESALMAAMALVLAGILIALWLPVFNHLTGKTLTLTDLQDPRLLLGLAVMTLLTGLISGAYPAFVISGFRPTQALRGTGVGKASQPARLRKGLVVFQFAISIFLIIGTAVVLSQLTYFRTKQLGFDKERVVHVRLGGELNEAVENNLETIKQELLRNPALLNVSLAADVPGERYSLESMSVDGHRDDEETMMRIAWGVDHDYLKTLRIELVAGRDFSREAPADTNAWIINEAAVKRLGLRDAVGRVLRWGRYAGPIVGVAKDFHFASLRHQIEPLVIPLRPGVGGMLLARVQGPQMAEALSFLEAALDRLVPGQLFSYSFVADDFDLLYRDEDKLRDVFGYFAAIAIFIACLGLFGLAAFTAGQRTKEIGVRKVLGASVAGIVLLLSKEFSKLVGLAFVVAAPLAYFAMDRWLQDFAYRIEISWGIFLIAGLAALGVAWLTVSYQSIRAALADPVDVLRYE